MLILIFIALFMLAIANYFLGRSVFYPGFVYCAAWSMALFCLLFSGTMFYPVSDESLAIFMWGAVAFTIGSAAGKFMPLSFKQTPQPEPNKVINLFIAGLVVAFPFYVLWVLRLIADRPGEFFLSAIHDTFVDMMDAGPEKFTPQYIFFINLMGFAPMAAMIAWAERKDKTKRAVLAVVVAMAYSLLTGGRLTVLRMLGSIVVIEWLTKKKLRFKHLAITGCASLVIFSAITLFLRVSTDSMDTRDKVAATVDQIVLYVASPLAAFDRVVRDPRIVPHNMSPANFFLETAAKLGMRVSVPPRASEFVTTGPDTKGNVFTIYFSYFDIGMPLGCILIAIQAFCLVLIYRAALAGRKIAIVMAAYLTPYIALSTFTELLMLDLNVTLKTFFCCWLLYSFPLVKVRFGRMLKEAALPR